MDKFLTQEGLNLISVLLVLGALGVGVLFYFCYEMEQDMLAMRQVDLDTDPQQFTPDAEYVRQVLAELGLRKDLPAYRNMDGAAQADIVDLKRGTSDKLHGLLP